MCCSDWDADNKSMARSVENLLDLSHTQKLHGRSTELKKKAGTNFHLLQAN